MAIPSASQSTLNSCQSALASVFRVVHPQYVPLGEEPLIKHFSKLQSEQYSPCLDWTMGFGEVGPLLQITRHCSSAEKLSLDVLRHKNILLLTLVTMWRPRSDIAWLRHGVITLHKTPTV
ncbi:hypothetical protein BX666DRAFT_1848385 [Dichotomocladium elegans]|nr:hypothetical protein BX666DRAFT_1848385 [Dichotomocladium elegans]